MLVEAEAAEEAILRSKSEPQGRVAISCPPALAAMVSTRPLPGSRPITEGSGAGRAPTAARRPATENIDMRVARALHWKTTGWWSLLGHSAQRLVARPDLAARLSATLTPEAHRHRPASTRRLPTMSIAGC
nr:hypothetical protein [Pseudomonas amygdali]